MTPVAGLTFNTTLMDSKCEEFSYDSFSPTGAPLFHGCEPGAPQPAPAPARGHLPECGLCTGKSLVRAPDVTGAASYERIGRLNDGRQVVFDSSAQSASSQYTSPDFIRAPYDDGYTTWSMNVTWEPAADWHVRLWGRNLTEEEDHTGGTKYPFIKPVDPSHSYLEIRNPRTYGVTGGIRF